MCIHRARLRRSPSSADLVPTHVLIDAYGVNNSSTFSLDIAHGEIEGQSDTLQFHMNKFSIHLSQNGYGQEGLAPAFEVVSKERFTIASLVARAI